VASVFGLLEELSPWKGEQWRENRDSYMKSGYDRLWRSIGSMKPSSMILREAAELA